ncbi:MAG: hypothetical protein E3J54_04670 [Actinobacteria bacterium]|nr:MAG: hypothetical protein E3J54_04670 [Actinomycetota bacterium]
MKTDLISLLELQDIDSAIQTAQKELEAMVEKKTYEKLQTELKDLASKERAMKEKLKAQNLVQDKKNGELEMLSQKIAKEEKKLFGGTGSNPKELAALQQEIKHLNQNRDLLETEVLENMEILSSLEEKMSSLKERIRERENEASEAESSVLEKETQLKGQLGKLANDRELKTKDIDNELLEEYDEIRERKGGLGVAALIDGICQACHVKVPATDLDKIINKDEAYDYCATCSRIIILKE